MTARDFSTRGVTSWKVERWVRSNSELKGTAFLVALTVASFHSARRGYAFPSIKLIAQASRVSITTVQRALEQMRETGEWEIDTGRGGKNSHNYAGARANRYYPTRKLAGQETELTDALTELGMQAQRDAYQAIYQGLHGRYKTDFVAQLRSGEFAEKIKQINDNIQEYADVDMLEETVREKLELSETPPNIILSWLAVWGTSREDSGAHNIDASETDYGNSGDGF